MLLCKQIEHIYLWITKNAFIYIYIYIYISVSKQITDFEFSLLLGNLCDICLDGYHGDPKGWYGEERPCSMCDCNGNIDMNAVGNCNR